MRRLLALIAVTVLASCGTAGTPGPVTTSSPVPTASPSPSSPTPNPTTSPSASPVTSAQGSITLRTPTAYAKLTSPLVISGDASVFEATLAWRITDTSGRVIAEGITTASAGAPARGTFSVSVPYTVPLETIAFVEVYYRSMKDGSIAESVQVPVTLR